MRLFLRVVRQRRWIRQPDEDWLKDGELKGDALSDLNTQCGRLSVYIVSSEAGRVPTAYNCVLRRFLPQRRVVIGTERQ